MNHRNGGMTVAIKTPIMKPKAKTLQERMGFKDADLTTPKHDEIMLWLNSSIDSLLTDLLPTRWTDADQRSHQKQLKHAYSVWLERLTSGYDLPSDDAHTIGLLKRDIDASRRNEDTENEFKAHERLASFLRSIKRSFPDPGPVPPCPPCSVTARLIELPVRIRDFVVGFIDFCATVRKPYAYLAGFEDSRVSVPRWLVDWNEVRLLFEVKASIPSMGELMRQLNHYRTYAEKGDMYYVLSPDDRFRPIIESQGIRFVKYEDSGPTGSLFD